VSAPVSAAEEDEEERGPRPGESLRADLIRPLRAWQKEAYREYFAQRRRDFLVVATPGAGKTAYALTVAAELLARREIVAVTVVTPTEHLKYQWAQAAHRVGIALDPAYRNAQGRASADFTGVAVTYAQVAAHPALHQQRTLNRRTLVVFDEIHHAGDALSWGDAVRVAFEPARRRLALTGTPFRSDTNPIPFVTYLQEPDGSRRSRADYVYGYGPALADGVVRPVIFLAYSGEMRWRTRAGDELAGTLGAPMIGEHLSQAWRTALNPDGEWITRVLETADRRLTEIRSDVPDAGGNPWGNLLRDADTGIDAADAWLAQHCSKRKGTSERTRERERAEERELAAVMARSAAQFAASAGRVGRVRGAEVTP